MLIRCVSDRQALGAQGIGTAPEPVTGSCPEDRTESQCTRHYYLVTTATTTIAASSAVAGVAVLCIREAQGLWPPGSRGSGGESIRGTFVSHPPGWASRGVTWSIRRVQGLGPGGRHSLSLLSSSQAETAFYRGVFAECVFCA